MELYSRVASLPNEAEEKKGRLWGRWLTLVPSRGRTERIIQRFNAARETLNKSVARSEATWRPRNC